MVRRILLLTACMAFLVGPLWGRPVPFGAQQTITTLANGTTSTFAADLDRDGDLDVLSVSATDFNVAWYENTDGAGTFGPRQIIFNSLPAFSSVWDVFAADVDGDGDMDVLTANAFSDSVTWFANLGGGAFGPEQVITTLTDGCRTVHAADLDGDGDTDVISGSELDDKVAWYENTDGAGTFGPQQILTAAGSGPQTVTAADVDGDGDLDVLSAGWGFGNKVLWFENTDGAGTFGAEQLIDAPSSPHGLSTGDIDGDGDLDVLVASTNDNTVGWYENTDGAGTYGPRQVITTTASAGRSVKAADFDADGDLDVIYAATVADTVRWHENTDGAGTFGPEQVITTQVSSPREVVAADVDGDGNLDVLSASFSDDRIAWYRNETIHRSAVFPERSNITESANGADSVYAADLDNDGDVDVLSASIFDDRVAWYENLDGDGSFGAQQTITTTANGARSVIAADVNGDGKQDVLSASTLGDEIAWYPNLGSGSFGAASVISSTENGAFDVYAADIDGDGDQDVLSVAFADDRLAWFENTDGAGTFVLGQSIHAPFAGEGSIFTADLDRDGDLDVLSSGASFDRIAWYENTDGAGTFGAQQEISILADAAREVFAADLDGDGDVDVISASWNDDKIAWYENTDGAATFGAQQIISSAPDGAEAIHAADMDLDGDLDIVSASSLDDSISWFENDGAANFGPRRIITTEAAAARSVFVADVDGDGDLDALSAAQTGDSIDWYRNRGGQIALTTATPGPLMLADGAVDDVLRIVAHHQGRVGDTDVELATLELLLESNLGAPLTDVEANAVVASLDVYVDTGSGVFEAGSDTLVATVPSLALTAGVQTVTFVDGSPDVQVVVGTPRTYFVVVEMTSDAEDQLPCAFRITHLTESTSTGEDRDNDILLQLEFATNVTTSIDTTADLDADLVCRAIDNCPDDFNPGQENADLDTLGNVCDPDDDDDGILDDGDGSGEPGDGNCVGGATTGCDDNCQFVSNPGQTDGNQNGIGTACEPTCDLVIGPQAGTDYPTIALAIPNADDGCRLLVRPATYTDPLTIDKFVRMVAEGSAADTIIDVGGAGTAVTIPPRDIPGRVYARGFTIRNAATAVTTDESITLEDCVVDTITDTGLRLILGDHELRRLTVDAAGADRGVQLEQFSTLEADRLRISGAAVAGADLEGDALLFNGVIVDNPGTGIRVASTGSLGLSFSTIAENALGLDVLSAASVDHSIVWGNTTEFSGMSCTDFTFSDLSVNCTGAGGNLQTNPAFVSVFSGDYHLTSSSPLIDTGDAPELFDGVPCKDFDGNPRLLDKDGDASARGDMGAFEFDNSAVLSPGDPQNLVVAGPTTLQWDAEPASAEYQINRGTISTRGYDYLVECLGTSLTTSFVLPGTIPPPGSAFYYFVSGKDGGGEEGTLGFGTCAERSKIFDPCP